MEGLFHSISNPSRPMPVHGAKSKRTGQSSIASQGCFCSVYVMLAENAPDQHVFDIEPCGINLCYA